MKEEEVINWVRLNIPKGVKEMLEDTISRSSPITKACLEDASTSAQELLTLGITNVAKIVAECLLYGSNFGHNEIIQDTINRRVLYVQVCPFEWQEAPENLRKVFPAENVKSVYRTWFNDLSANRSFELFPRQIHLIFYCSGGRVVPRLGAVYNLLQLEPELQIKDWKWWECFPYEFGVE